MNTYEEQLRDNVNHLERRIGKLQHALIAALRTLEGVQSGHMATNGGEVAMAIAAISGILHEEHNSYEQVA